MRQEWDSGQYWHRSRMMEPQDLLHLPVIPCKELNADTLVHRWRPLLSSGPPCTSDTTSMATSVLCMVRAGNFRRKLLVTISDAPYKYMY